MSGKRLSELEAEQRAEEKANDRWMRKHEKLLDPAYPEQKQQKQVMQQGQRVERLLKYGLMVDQAHDTVTYEEGARFVPLISQPQEFDLKRAEVSARVRHVLAFMEEAQRDLLMAYYVEGASWKTLRRGEESRQAVHERLAWARNAFYKAFIAHAEDTIDIKEADL